MVEPVATEREGMKEEDDIFQIRLFLSTSLFQKSVNHTVYYG